MLGVHTQVLMLSQPAFIHSLVYLTFPTHSQWHAHKPGSQDRSSLDQCRASCECRMHAHWVYCRKGQMGSYVSLPQIGILNQKLIAHPNLSLSCRGACKEHPTKYPWTRWRIRLQRQNQPSRPRRCTQGWGRNVSSAELEEVWSLAEPQDRRSKLHGKNHLTEAAQSIPNY